MDNTLKVKGNVDSGSYLFTADVSGHEYKIDYPQEGYKEEGALPGGVLAFALAGCKALVVASYFNGRDKDVDIEVEVDASFDQEGEVSADFDVKINLEGDVEEGDLDKVKKIVDEQCAVEQVLLSEDNSVSTEYNIK